MLNPRSKPWTPSGALQTTAIAQGRMIVAIVVGAAVRGHLSEVIAITLAAVFFSDSSHSARCWCSAASAFWKSVPSVSIARESDVNRARRSAPRDRWSAS